MRVAAVFLIASLAALTACGGREEATGPREATPTPPQAADAVAPGEAPVPVAPGLVAPDAAVHDAAPAASEHEVDAASDPVGAPSTSTQAAAASTGAASSAGATATATGSGTVLKADKLYSEPSASARVTASVAKGAKVDILAKEGGWLRVKAGNDSGWIRLLSVRAGTGGLGSAALGDVVGAATTRSDPTRVVAVAGLRGLNDEDLKQAQFNAEELARLEASTPSATQVRSFASQAGLATASVPDLPKPQARQSSSTWENN